MSYEGYYQKICAKGHYYTYPETYGMEPDVTNCPTCGAKEAWSNQVDDTNLDEVGFIDMNPFIISPHEVSRSKLPDGRFKTVRIEGQYRIPTEEETKSLQTYCDEKGNRVLLKK